MTPEEIQAQLDKRITQVEGIMSARQGPDVAEALPQNQGAVLDQRINTTRAALRDQGIADPEDTSAVQNSLNAFWSRFSELAGTAMGAIPGGDFRNNIQLALRQAGEHAAADKYDNTKTVKRFLNAVGIRTDTYQGLSEKIGKNTLDGAITLSATLAAAPTLIAAGMSTPGRQAITEFGKFLQNNPGLAAVQEIGSIFGVSAAQQVTEGSPLETTAAMVGGAVGGAVPQVAKNLGGMALGMVARPARMFAQATGIADAPVMPDPTPGALNPDPTLRQRIGSALGVQPKTPFTEPLLSPELAKSQYPRYFAEEQVEGAKRQIDLAVNEAVDRISDATTRRGKPLSPQEAQVNVRDDIDKAYKVARRIEGDHWAQVPMRLRVDGRELVNDIFAMEQRLTGEAAESFIPRDHMKDIYGIFKPGRDPDTGQMTPAPASVQRVRSTMKHISESMYREPDNVQLNANRTELLNLLNKAVANSLPDEVPLSQARAVSTHINDLFTRGPISDIRRVQADRSAGVPPDRTVQALLDQYQGIKSLLNIGDLATMPRIPGQGDAFPHSTRSVREGRPIAAQLREDTEIAIRRMVQERAQFEGDPRAVVKFVDKYEREIAPLTNASTDLRRTADYITAHQEHREVVSRSALARFANSDTDTALRAIWNSKDPVRQTRELVASFHGNPDAMEGLQQATLKLLMGNTRGDFVRVQNALETPRFREMLETVLTPQQMTRLAKLTDIGVRIARGDEDIIRDFMRNRFTLAGKILGAAAGRSMGTGTLQAPSLVSNMVGRWVERVFSVTDPVVMFQRAVLDPKWEAIMWSKMPEGSKDIRALTRNMRRLLGTGTGLLSSVGRTTSAEEED